MGGHRFKARTRAILREQKQSDSTAIKRQLAQVVPDAPRTAYNRGKFLDERKMKMQQRADYFDQPGAGADAMPLCGERT